MEHLCGMTPEHLEIMRGWMRGSAAVEETRAAVANHEKRLEAHGARFVRECAAESLAYVERASTGGAPYAVGVRAALEHHGWPEVRAALVQHAAPAAEG